MRPPVLLISDDPQLQRSTTRSLFASLPGLHHLEIVRLPDTLKRARPNASCLIGSWLKAKRARTEGPPSIVSGQAFPRLVALDAEASRLSVLPDGTDGQTPAPEVDSMSYGQTPGPRERSQNRSGRR